jgi:hypothetical protein
LTKKVANLAKETINLIQSCSRSFALNILIHLDRIKLLQWIKNMVWGKGLLSKNSRLSTFPLIVKLQIMNQAGGGEIRDPYDGYSTDMMIKLSYWLFVFVSCNDIGQRTLQKYLKMPGDKPESHFVIRVNNREGCWYNSRQDHNPSFTLSNQIKWQDVTLPPCVCSPQ